MWQIDGNILLWIQDYLRTPILTDFFKVITSLANSGAIWIILTIIMIINKKTRKIGCLLAYAEIASFFINNLMLKNFIARIRPYDAIEGLTRLIGVQKDFSFPSGHTAASFVFAFTISKYVSKGEKIFYYILASLIAFSRLYLGVHYPSDVIGAIIISFIIAVIVHKIDEKIGLTKDYKVDVKKDLIRYEMRDVLSEMDKKTVHDNSVIIQEKVIELIKNSNEHTILVYMNSKSEVETDKIIEFAIANGKKVGIPKVDGKKMTFYEYREDLQLTEGYMGILEPNVEEAKELIPRVDDTLVIMPGLAFDLRRNRLGHGKGYYDKYLSEKRGMHLYALAHEIQILPKIASDANDVRPDIIVTEKRLIK
ncbi:MAG: 5-formyltetrahydrofolate cyclo-ligase [Lachnospiraceae bacterium]|jgi:undecaprenyl-diphosphatase|nr:5-formyltetrahydrofolate cyclo-ligase [Lachnospiraceae bacterium]